MTGKVLGALSLFMMVLLLTGCPDPGAPSPDYPRILIETYKPQVGAPVPLTTIYLFDAAGSPLASKDRTGLGADENTSIDYTAGLDAGIYYVKIIGDGSSLYYYAVRVLSLSLGETPPAYDYPGVLSPEGAGDSDDADTGNVPASPVAISPGNTEWENRAIDPASDIDWLRLELP